MAPLKPEDRILALRQDLAERRKEILMLAPETVLERILESPQPAPLVHTFPEEDLHLLIREIGPDDALPLIALASQKQLEYMLDQELWQRDSFDLAATARWLDRLLRAEGFSPRLVRWLAEEKTDLVELFLCRSIEVQMREHDQDPSVFGPGFFTYDDVFFIRILAPPPNTDRDAAAFSEMSAQETVKRLLDHLVEYDYPRFQAILLEAAHLLPAETEEEAYRLRTGRLAEKGFLPYEEAIGLYQPMSDPSLAHKALRHKIMAPEHPDHFSLVPTVVLSEGSLFTRALASIDSSAQRLALQEEFAALCNRIIIADRQTIHRREDLAAVVAKATGYLNIGLQKCQSDGASRTKAVATAARELRRCHLEGLFRRGYNEALKLKQAAEKWIRESWFAARGLPLTFWGETWLGVIGGLLVKRPRFLDNYRSGTLYRDFADRQDIEWTCRQFDQVQAFDHLLKRLDFSFAKPASDRFLTYQSLLLTVWARHCLGLAEEVRPISTAAFRPLFQSLFEHAAAPSPDGRRRIPAALRESFLQWLADRADASAVDLAASIGPSLESLFVELEEHYGGIRPADIDPRYFPHFLLKLPALQPK